jgi:transposase
MTEKQLDELFPEMTLNPNSRARKKCLVVYLRKKGYQREEVAELLRIDEDTVTNYTKKYDESGLQGLLEENYHQPKSQLEPYTEQLKELFKKQVPHTVNQAIEMIDKETGICLKPSACREFLRKIGMKCRRCGVVPGKAMDDDKQRQAQQEFHDKQLTFRSVRRCGSLRDGCIFRDGLVLRASITAFCQRAQTPQCLRRL